MARQTCLGCGCSIQAPAFACDACLEVEALERELSAFDLVIARVHADDYERGYEEGEESLTVHQLRQSREKLAAELKAAEQDQHARKTALRVAEIEARTGESNDEFFARMKRETRTIEEAA